MKFSPLYDQPVSKRGLIIAAGVMLLLSLVSSFYFRVNPSVSYEEKKLEQYIHNQQKDFELQLQDSILLRKLVQKTETIQELKSLTKKDYGFFLYVETLSGPSLFFWNNQNIIPPDNALQLPDGEHFQRLSNGYYLILKKGLHFSGMSNNIQAFALIPIMYQYERNTEIYLQTHFAHDEEAINKIKYSESRTPYVIHSLYGKPLFYIEEKAHTPIMANDSITLTLRLFAFILILLFIHLEAETVARDRGPAKGVLFLTTVLIGVRAILYLLPSLFFFRQFQLFDPQIYSTNWLNSSLGDLLFNAIVFCWIVLFAWYKLGQQKRLSSFLKGPWILVVGVLGVFILILSTFLLASIVRSLVADSSISFNVTFFFSLSVYTAVGFFVLALLSLTYYYFTRLLFQLILPAFEKRQILIYFIIAVVGLLYLTFRSGNPIVLFHIPVLLWLVIYTLLLSQEQFIINRFKVTIAGMLFWIFVFSVSLSVIIINENQKKELKTQENLAEKQHELTDPSQERTLSIALNYLDNEFFTYNFHRFTNPVSSQYLRDSIIKENMLAGYRRAYNTKIFVFDSLYQGLYNTDPSTFSELNSIFTIRSKPTGIPDLYYHEPSFDKITYITRRIIQDTTGLIGTVFIVASPIKYGSETLTPELFRQVNKKDVEMDYYPFAVYNRGILISASSKYPFPTSLTYKEIPKKEYELRQNGDYDELWYKATNNKVIVTVKKKDTFLESITLFSYFFCAFLVMVAILQLLVMILRTAYGWNFFEAFSELSIRSQVHGIVIFISVLSFLIIGVATISFFITRFNRNNIDQISETSGIMVKEMERRIDEQGQIDDISNLGDSTFKANLKKLVEDVANIHNREINVYDVKGNLQFYSNAEVYQRGVLSTKIHPIAYYHLNRMRQVHYVQKESMSSLEYLSIYTPVRNDNGFAYAYLNIPYFNSGYELQQEISNFLVTIINLNAFIFLIAGVIALFITNRITRSFSVIGNKMREITLGQAIEEIEWTRKDEIGELVSQYNKMVHKLEESAAALAKSEREGAWREMARQVAHEIKNPLTPMKLSIQYLQKAINNNQPNIRELTSRVANTLVEQIDHLSKIAADFSRFANIGNRHIEEFDLHQVLDSLMDLYKTNPKVRVNWGRLEGDVIVSADKTHINRLFTNLLTNAVEACNQRDICYIDIIEEGQADAILIKVKDNGEGIPVEMHPKIFTPNFTTKSSGTGLGLAMCKGIVEQAGGEIWFETEEGIGTTFFVQLPAKVDRGPSLTNNQSPSIINERDKG